MAIRVLICEDHVMVRQGLRSLLEQAGMEVVAEAGDGREAVRQAGNLRPDVAVLDVEVPLLNGIEVARTIQREGWQTRTIVLTMYPERTYLLEALRAGVHGYLLKTKAADNLVHAVREVAQGAIHLGPDFSREVLKEILDSAALPEDPLTAREREVLLLVAEGKTTKEVASILGIGAKTAESHRARIMEKLDIHEAAGLVRYAVRRGLIRA